jgi:hypothetical protein
MSLINSLLFADKGSYNILGTKINFNEDPQAKSLTGLENAGLISKLAIMCINSNLFRLASQGYTHVLVHEMGHALTYKLLVDKNHTPSITIFKDTCQGVTKFPRDDKTKISPLQQTMISVAGSMTNIAFSILKIIIANSLVSFISVPIALIIRVSSIIWISGELLYSFSSSISKNGFGDFNSIKNQGSLHLLAASVALIIECALGIFVISYTKAITI